jgi:pimeloyl-ACP methyl ester carboxylesterase
MLHGWPVDHRHMVKDFEPLFEHRDGWKRLYPDMPGMGQTVADPIAEDRSGPA